MAGFIDITQKLAIIYIAWQFCTICIAQNTPFQHIPSFCRKDLPKQHNSPQQGQLSCTILSAEGRKRPDPHRMRCKFDAIATSFCTTKGELSPCDDESLLIVETD